MFVRKDLLPSFNIRAKGLKETKVRITTMNGSQ